MSDLVFVGIGVLAVVVWQLVAAARRARRDGTPILVRLRHGLRRRPPRSIDVSIAARGAWMHSLAAAYAPAPMRVVIQARELAVLVCAMVAVAGTEAVVAFGPVILGEALAAGLVPLLLVGLPERLGREGLRGTRRVNLALRALAIVPLARVITIAMAHPDVSDAVTVLATALVVSWLAIRVASTAELDRWSLVALPLQPVPILAGAVLGVVAYIAGAPALAARGADTSEVVVAAVALVVAGAAEELVFRGVLQGTLQRAAGRPGVILGVLVFASTYVGFRSLELVLVMLLAGLLFANAVMRTGATGATMLGHALLGLGAGVVWPRVLGEDARTWLDETKLVVLLALAIVGALYLVLRGRGASLVVRRGGRPAPDVARHPANEDWFADV